MGSKSLFLLLIILIFSASTNPQTIGDISREIKVNLIVSANENIEAQIKSYLSRELRSLGDVNLVESYDDPNYKINIVAMEAESVSGYKTGIVFSVVVLEPIKYRIKILANSLLITDVLPVNYKEMIEFRFKNWVLYNTKIDSLINEFFVGDAMDYKGHWVQLGARDELKEVCEKIIADFDGDFLSEYRKILDRMKDETH